MTNATTYDSIDLMNEKLSKKFLTDPKHITIEDCDKLLTDYGYELRKGGGSHRTYHKKGLHPITVVVPKGTKYINTPYIGKIIRDLGLEE